MVTRVSMRRGVVKRKGKPKQKSPTAPDGKRESSTREQEWLAHGAAAASVGWAAKNAAASSGLLSATQWAVLVAAVVTTAVGAGAWIHSGQSGRSTSASGSGAGSNSTANRAPKLSDTPAEKLTYRRTELVAPSDDGGVGSFPGGAAAVAANSAKPDAANSPASGTGPASNRLDVVGSVDCTIPAGNLRQMEEAIWRCAAPR